MHTLAVLTGTRADYGLLRPVLEKMRAHPGIAPRLLVTGAHLSAAYGATVSEIEADGFDIAARLDILSPPVPPGRAGTAQRTQLALRLFLDWLSAPANRPSALVVLGDRYEAFAAGQAAALLGIPLVHISGGDVTEGADDDWFRHCLTKMAKLHFPSCEVYRQRVIRMGEEPGRVFNVGGLGDENIRNMQLLSFQTLAAGLDFALLRPFALVTMHPETASALAPERQAEVFLAAIERQSGLFYLFTGANADAGGSILNQRFAAFCETRVNAAMVPSLGMLRYLSAMKHAALVLGNSSSGVVETPSMGVPAVDVGDRQKGREDAENVLHCPLDAAAISGAVSAALRPEFAAAARRVKSPYNGGETSQRIVDITFELLESGQLNRPKSFYDGEGSTCGS